MTPYLIFLVAALVVLTLAFWKPLTGRIDRLNLRWPVAWLKAVVIFLAIALLVFVVPAKVMELQAVADMDRKAQDLVGSGTWAVGIVITMWALRRAQKADRI